VTAANGLIHHNVLFCHLFDALTKSQGMASLLIGAKSNTVCGLLKSTFPAIKTTNHSPTPYVTPATVAYIHALIIDSVTANPTESASQRALLCKNVARQELESIDIALFHEELRIAMTSYYEGILKMPGVSGVANKASYKRPFKRMTDGDVDVHAPAPATGAAANPAAAALFDTSVEQMVGSPLARYVEAPGIALGEPSEYFRAGSGRAGRRAGRVRAGGPGVRGRRPRERARRRVGPRPGRRRWRRGPRAPVAAPPADRRRGRPGRGSDDRRRRRGA
jgi:hypothetical protein